MARTVRIDQLADAINEALREYANLAAEPPLREGAKVNAGDTVGTVGDTAVSECGEKSHLHFGLYVNGESADPQEYVLFDKSLE